MPPPMPRAPGLPFGGGPGLLLAAGAAYFAWEHEPARRRTASPAVPAVLAEQDRPGPRSVRWLSSGRAAGTGLTGMLAGVSPLAAHRLPVSCSPRGGDQILMPLTQAGARPARTQQAGTGSDNGRHSRLISP